MQCKYDIDFNSLSIESNIKRITNQIYKLLPIREEGGDWQSPLHTIQEELAGMNQLLIGQHQTLFQLMCKLEGLFALEYETDFYQYRRTIFECLSLANSFKSSIG